MIPVRLACRPALAFIFLLVIIGWVAAPRPAAEPQLPPQGFSEETAREFVRAVRPELSGQGLWIGVFMEGALDKPSIHTSFNVEVFKRVPPAGEVGLQEKKVLWTGYLSLTRDEYVEEFSGDSTASEKTLSELRALVDAHPKWSDPQVIQALKRAGARFGPDDKEQLLKSLNLTVLEPFLGTVGRRSASFQLRNEAQMQHGLPAAELHWTVDVLTKQRCGEALYFLIVEPFDARVIQIGLSAPTPGAR